MVVRVNRVMAPLSTGTHTVVRNWEKVIKIWGPERVNQLRGRVLAGALTAPLRQRAPHPRTFHVHTLPS
jgi:hypothetical protein